MTHFWKTSSFKIPRCWPHSMLQRLQDKAWFYVWKNCLQSWFGDRTEVLKFHVLKSCKSSTNCLASWRVCLSSRSPALLWIRALAQWIHFEFGGLFLIVCLGGFFTLWTFLAAIFLLPIGDNSLTLRWTVKRYSTWKLMLSVKIQLSYVAGIFFSAYIGQIW